MANTTIKPKQVVQKLMKAVADRTRDVVVRRFGIGPSSERETLEAIGASYGITRERVRQIEEHGLAQIRKSEEYRGLESQLEELKKAVDALGAVVAEEQLLSCLSKDTATRNALAFLFVLADPFTRLKETDTFHPRWVTDKKLAEQVHASLERLTGKLEPHGLVSEKEILSAFERELGALPANYKKPEVMKSWLCVSKKIGCNPLGEWGRASSPNVSVKGIRDYAYLVIRKHGSPIHFREVAKAIEKTFGKKAHVATCHNELIKDKRFVLVGRGLYALSEWGYATGVVRDVIRDVLKKHGPMTKDEVVEKVLKERLVKENTILVNLQNQKHFKRAKDGRYAVAA